MSRDAAGEWSESELRGRALVSGFSLGDYVYEYDDGPEPSEMTRGEVRKALWPRGLDLDSDDRGWRVVRRA